MDNLKVNDVRIFNSMRNRAFAIKEILENSDIEETFCESDFVCSFCGKKNERYFNYRFSRIEILVDMSKLNNYTPDDVAILGFTIDNRTLLFKKNQYDKVFEKSNAFKNFMEVR